MPSPHSEAEMKMAREIAGRFYQGIRDHDYAKWVLDGHKDNTTGVQIALAAIQATRSTVAEERLREAAERALQILERNLHRQTEKCDDAVRILRAALTGAAE